MHIPDAYLSPLTQAAAWGVMAPVLALSVRKTRQSLSSRQAPLLSVGAAFCFAIQMFNIPALGGTTAHALGTVMLAILLGPWAALLAMTLTLAVQALFFGDGGVLSLGINAFDMALIPSFTGYGLYRLIASGSQSGTRRSMIAAAVASYSGTAFASLSAGLILGLQPSIAHDAAGRALYFPFGMSISVPAMLYTHLLIAAPAEAIITVFALAYLWKSFPDLAPAVGSKLRLARPLTVVLLLTPLGLIAGGSAWGEWDLDTLKQLVGYVPSGVARSTQLVHPVLPDYSIANNQGHLWEVFGYLLSAIVGAGLVVLVTRTVVFRRKPPAQPNEQRLEPGATLPSWLARPNPTDFAPDRKPAKLSAGSRPIGWLESILLRMRRTVEETIARENVARVPGLLQRIHPSAKTALALSGLAAISLTSRPALLGTIFAAVHVAAVTSAVPAWPFLRRVAIAVAFFGLVVSAPLALRAVTPGSPVFGSGLLTLSDTGLAVAATMLLRLACGIGLTLLWTLTTRWNDLIRSLRRLGLPAFFCSGLTLAYRYMFVVMETLDEMVTARRSRQIGRLRKSDARSYAGAGAAILFAKSYAFTEEIHMAMRSRCFDLDGSSFTPRRWSRSEALSVACGLFLVLLLASLKVIHAV